MARIARGTKLLMGDAPATGIEVFAPVAELTSIGLPSFGAGTVDVTNYDSTSEEFISTGIQEHGEFEVEGNWMPSNATHDGTAGLLAVAKSGEARNFKIEVPAGANGGQKLTLPFKAFVTFAPQAGGPKDPLKFKANFRPTGPIAPTLASS